MYFPIGWARHLAVDQAFKHSLKCITTNRYNMLFAVITEATISIWHCKPCVEITCYQRSSASLQESGKNELAEWRQDSSMLAISTDKGHLLIYQLEQDVQGEKGLMLYKYHQAAAHQGDSNDAIPALRLSLIMDMSCNASITSLSSMQDKLLVAQKDGKLKILLWEAPLNVVEDLAVQDIPFSVDMHLSGTRLREKDVFISDAVCSPFLDGFSAVFSDGRAARIVFNNLVDESNSEQDSEAFAGWSAKGVWAPGISNATCTAVNNKYRLLSFGNKTGGCCIYMVDDMNGSLLLSHTISLSPTNYPTLHKVVGSVLKISWSSDGCALALSWAKGGLSVWSVFGACLTCTIPSDQPVSSSKYRLCSEIFISMCWGVEGYNLWLLANKNSDSKSTEDDQDAGDSQVTSGQGSDVEGSKTSLLLLPFLKSSLAMNPCMSNHSHILLHSEDRLYLSVGERSQIVSVSNSDGTRYTSMIPRSSTYSASLSNQNDSKQGAERSTSLHDLKSQMDFTTAVSSYDLANGDKNPSSPSNPPPSSQSTDMSSVGNKQWIVIPYPASYLPNNWPIRFATIDHTGSYLAIAGNFGLAHYALAPRKWKVFGNVIQEKDMVVTGGMTWWKEFLVVACYTLSSNQEEIRVYPRHANLDNSFACIQKVNSQILLINVFQNMVILFTYGCQIKIFVLSLDNSQRTVPTAKIRHLQDIGIGCYVLYPTLVVSVTMTSLHMESAARRHSSSAANHGANAQRDTKVILINVAGRLLLLQQSPDDDMSSIESVSPRKKMKFMSPSVLATCVENIWTTERKNSEKIHLTDALWIGCGSMGVRVWLPLFPPSQALSPLGTSIAGKAANGNSHHHHHHHHHHQKSNNHHHHHHSRTSSTGLELQLLTSRRITLTFQLDTCYPLSVMYDKAVILGVTSERWQYQNVVSNDTKEDGTDDVESNKSCMVHFSSIDHNCEIFLQQLDERRTPPSTLVMFPQILCQLLRRNLGYHALQLASTCRSLSCFPHVLELMLHEVLEEEATASEPIPDPLLPTVIKFIAEFPEYHMTVVHCARKTEIALWEYLFNYVGSPKELFEECLQTDQLQTAASYLIILQNLELLAVARQDATRLFDRALQQQQWSLANEIVRFLRAIGDGDASAAPRHPTLMNANIYPAVSPTTAYLTQGSSSVDGDTGFKFGVVKTKSVESKPAITTGAATLTRTDSFTMMSSAATSQPYVAQHPIRKYHPEQPIYRPLVSTNSNPLSENTPPSARRNAPSEVGCSQKQKLNATECAEHYFIDVILARQARKMLSERRMQSLGKFAAHVDFQLVPWLRKERNRAARVDDAVASLKALHEDFEWSYPQVSSSVYSASVRSHGSASVPLSLKHFSKAMNLSPPNYKRPALSDFDSPRNFAGSHESVIALSARRGSISSQANELQTEASETSETVTGGFDPNFSPPLLDLPLNVAAARKNSSDNATRDSSRSELQLRYLLELVLEAFCLEWALLICLLLQEPNSLQRLIKSAQAVTNTHSDNFDSNASLSTMQRLRMCLMQVQTWAEKDCLGYVTVLRNMEDDLERLRGVINQSEIVHAENQALLAHKKMSNMDGGGGKGLKRFHSVHDDVSAAAADRKIEDDIPLQAHANQQLAAAAESQELAQQDSFSHCAAPIQTQVTPPTPTTTGDDDNGGGQVETTVVLDLSTAPSGHEHVDHVDVKFSHPVSNQIEMRDSDLSAEESSAGDDDDDDEACVVM